jgi:hypothetical protein
MKCRPELRTVCRCCGALALAACLTASVAVLTAQISKPTEYQVKAAYLSNFGRFVDWPPRPRSSPDDPFDLCILGQDPFGSALDTAVAGEKIAGLPLAARRISRPAEALGCRILFVSTSESNQLDATLAAVASSPVLTVAEIPDFVKRGGMIQFVLDGNRVRFEINLVAARRSGLSLSSQLLNVARAVRRTP